MAKVMISLPDGLLARIDERARATARTRSGLLQELAERDLEVSGRDRTARVAELLGEPASRGGDSTDFIRRDRHRDDS